MVSWQKVILVILSINGSISVTAQTVNDPQNLLAKPVTFDKLRVEACIGVGISRFDRYYNPKPLVSPYSEINLIIPLSYRVRLRTGFTYQVIGSVSTYSLPDGLAKASRRLPYLSTQVTAGYNLSKAENRVQIELQGGIFLAKKLDDETINSIPNNPISRNKSIDSSIGFNGGIVLGSSASLAVTGMHRLGVKLLYHQGVIDTRTLAAKQNTGSRSLFTQAFTICTYLSI